MTVGSPSSSSIAPHFSHRQFPPPPKLPAQASRSQPATREDPSRAPPALPAGSTPQPYRGLSSPPRPSFRDILNVFFLPCRRQRVRENSARVACAHSNLSSQVRRRRGQPRAAQGKGPGDGGSCGSAAARARAGARAGPGLGASGCTVSPDSGRFVPCWFASRNCFAEWCPGLAQAPSGHWAVYEGGRRHSHPKTLERHADRIVAAETCEIETAGLA